jgi:hypothetical protein
MATSEQTIAKPFFRYEITAVSHWEAANKKTAPKAISLQRLIIQPDRFVYGRFWRLWLETPNGMGAATARSWIAISPEKVFAALR